MENLVRSEEYNIRNINNPRIGPLFQISEYLSVQTGKYAKTTVKELFGQIWWEGILQDEQLKTEVSMASQVVRVSLETLTQDSSLVKLKVKVETGQSCLALYDSMDYTVHEILQARILEWVAFPFFGDLPEPGIQQGSPALQANSLPTELLVKSHISSLPKMRTEYREF